MHAAPARFASVSELYSHDEVELLLDEIRHLEPTSCQGEDSQDFEIAGSGVVAAEGGGLTPGSGTGATERSWDSHAGYGRGAAAPPRALAPLHCAWRAAGARGALLGLLALLGLGAASLVWAAAGRRALPLQGRVRALQLGALCSALAHGTLLFLRVSRLQRLLPLRWAALTLALAAASCLSLAAGGALTLHAVLLAPEYRWAPPPVARPLLAAAALGLCGSAAAGALAALCLRRVGATCSAYRPVPAPAPEPEPAPEPAAASERSHAL